jgi:hypothetical protein
MGNRPMVSLMNSMYDTPRAHVIRQSIGQSTHHHVGFWVWVWGLGFGGLGVGGLGFGVINAALASRT